MPNILCNVNVRIEGAQPRQLAASTPRSLKCDCLHEISLTVPPAGKGKKTATKNVKLALPGEGCFAMLSVDSPPTGSLRVNPAGVTAFELIGPHVCFAERARKIVAGLANVTFQNTSSSAQTVTLLLGTNLPGSDAAGESRGGVVGSRKTARKTAAKKDAAKKVTKRKTTNKKKTRKKA